MKTLITILLFIASIFPGMSQEKAVIKAQKSIEKGNLEKALESIESAVKHKDTKTSGHAWLVYGQIYSDMSETNSNHAKTALKAFTKAKELGLNEKLAKQCEELEEVLGVRASLMGAKAYDEKTYLDAIQYFEVVRDLRPNDPAGYYNVATASFKAGNFEQAVSNYKSLFDLGVNSNELYEYIIDTSTRTKKPSPETEVWLRDAMQLYPKDMELWKQLEFNYKIRTQTGDTLEETINKWFDADTTNATNAELNFELGATYYALSDTSMAAQYYKKSIALDPNYASPVYNLGVMHFNEALVLYQAAANVPFQEKDKYTELENKGLEKMKLALPYLERTVEIEPNNVDAWNGLSKIYAKLHMLEKMKHAQSQYRALSGN